jgi:uridine phosphorylase
LNAWCHRLGEEHSDTVHFLGRHTALSYVIDQRRVWKRIPYLRDNEGRAPPLVLAVGDRRRVYSIARKLKKPVFLPETAARLSGQRASEKDLRSALEFGRVAMAIGLVSSSVPVLVVETQMGAPATQIIMNEVLSDELTSTVYRVGKSKIDLPYKIVIRVGTAGGINCDGKPAIEVGDIVNATHSIGATGAVIQSLRRLDFWSLGAIEEFRKRWIGLGPDFTITVEGHPRVECSRDVVEALDDTGRRLATDAYHRGGNVTKDSLYAELSDDVFLELCYAHNCRCTEMELSAIAVSARKNNAHFGMVSAIVGVLPGASFTKSEKAKTLAEQRSQRVALEAAKNLASQERRIRDI